jgi:hypothetical protein
MLASRPMRPTRFPWLVPLLLGGMACGDGGPSADDVAETAPDDTGVEGEGGGADAGCSADGGTLDLAGVWAGRLWIDVYLVTPEEGIVTLCPDRYFGVTVITLRVTAFRQAGGRVDHHFNVCRMDIPAADAAIDRSCAATVRMAMAIGPALTGVWPALEYSGGAQLGGTEACSSYLSDPLEVLFGVDDTIGIHDTLPTWREGCETTAERCVDGFEHAADDDGDGNPGVTLTVHSPPDDLIEGRVFTAFRSVEVLRGTARDSTLVLGEVDPSMDYQLLDSDVRISAATMPPYLVRHNIPVFDVPPTGSTFVLVRADGRHGADDLDTDGSGEVTCGEILAAEALFAPYQP